MIEKTADFFFPGLCSQTSGLLLERLQAWKHACGYLESYIVATEKVEKAHAKEYEKVLKVGFFFGCGMRLAYCFGVGDLERGGSVEGRASFRSEFGGDRGVV